MRSSIVYRLDYYILLFSMRLTFIWMLANADSKGTIGQLQQKIAGCQSNRRCPAIPIQPVCGSDRKTYTNVCMLKIAMCTSSPASKLKLAHVGKCKSCMETISTSLSKVIAYWKGSNHLLISSSSRCSNRGSLQYDSYCLRKQFNAADRDTDGEVTLKEFMQFLRPLRHMFNDRRCIRRLWIHCSNDGKESVVASNWIKCFNYKGKTKCQQQKETAAGEAVAARGHYNPRCDVHGHFEAIQCHLSTGFCWCSTPDGKPIPGSSVRNKQPNCTIVASSKCFQRVQQLIKSIHSHPDISSSPVPRCLETGDYAPLQCHRAVQQCWCVTTDGNEVEGTRISTSKGLPRCQGCVPSAEGEFNLQFIKAIANSRDSMSSMRRSSSPLSSNRVIHRLLRWKFLILDRNNDSLLNTSELNDVIQEWKNASRVCGESTVVRCDANTDGGLSLSEWRRCFSITISTHLTQSKQGPTSAPICTPMRICTLACPRGFQRDTNGCLQCKCRSLGSLFKGP